MALLGHIVTEETRAKLRKANLGKKVSPEVRLKISKSLLGNSYAKGYRHTADARRRMSLAHTGVKLSPAHRATLLGNKRRLGLMHSDETKEKMRLSHLGPLAGNWKGGITPINRAIRTSRPYKEWRIAVYRRDKFSCQECSSKMTTKNKLDAHHIKSFARFPEHRFDVSNGLTLCKPCHRKTDTYAGRVNRIAA